MLVMIFLCIKNVQVAVFLAKKAGRFWGDVGDSQNGRLKTTSRINETEEHGWISGVVGDENGSHICGSRPR